MSLMGLGAVGLVAGLLGGCASSTRAPELTVTSAEVSQRSADGAVILFSVHADNANPDQLPLRDVEYDVALDGQKVFHGSRSAEATVRRYGTQDFYLPAAVPTDRMPEGREVRYTIKGRLTYLVPGALAETLFDMDVIRPSTGFRGEGIVTERVETGGPLPPGASAPRAAP